MFEQAFKNIDDVLRKEAGCTTELDYTEQTSWLLFLKYLDSLEQDKADEAALQGLAEKGFGREQMAEMQRIIDAEKSDLFDVLAHIAYALPTLTREERAARAKVVIGAQFTTRQQAFLEFVLAQYVQVGVEELDREKLPPLLMLRYQNSFADALADLGPAEQVGAIFAGFQKYLYQPGA
jgi:type I restriction enzyme R subunit